MKFVITAASLDLPLPASSSQSFSGGDARMQGRRYGS